MAVFIAMGLFAMGVSVYGFWISPRTKGNRLFLQPGFIGLTVVAASLIASYIPERWTTGPAGFLIWVVGFGPLIVWWGYSVFRDLLALKKQMHR